MAISVKHRSLLAGAACLMIFVGVPINAADAVAHTRHRPDARADSSRHQRFTIEETATMRLVGQPGHVMHERGRVSGTESGTCFETVTFGYANAQSTITVYTSRGSLTVTAITRVLNPIATQASYAGTATVIGGTGKWAQASGDLKVSGTVDRHTFQTIAYIRGSLVV